MTDIQAAIGLHQLRKLPQFQACRHEIVCRYNEAFSQFEELQRLNLERFSEGGRRKTEDGGRKLVRITSAVSDEGATRIRV